MKRGITLVLAVLLLLSLFGCGRQTQTADNIHSVTDSLGRTVMLPDSIEKIAVTGPMAQLALFALCPEKLIGLAAAWDSSAAPYLDERYLTLPVIGQLYGGKGDLNPETLLQSGAEVIFDVGEAKEGLADELDHLQEQTGIPVLHISAGLATMGDTYRLLGELLGKPDEAEMLARYCEEVYERIFTLSAEVEKVRALYVTGDAGQNVIAKDSYHSEAFDLLCDNLAVLQDPAAKGTGNEVGMEQILLWDPEYIVFAPNSVYGEVADDPVWQTLRAVQNGRYCEVPAGPDNWMGFPPGVQRYLGMLWLGKMLYSDAVDYNLYTETARFYELFYHCELTPAQFDALTANSIH